MDSILYWIETEGTGHWFFYAFPVAILCLFIWFKGRRVRFLIPALLISAFIINPWFYTKWSELGLYAYWRILWVVPVIPVIASLVPSISEKTQNNWLKTVVCIAGVIFLTFGGTFLYEGNGGSFFKAAGATKLPEHVIQIADRLLEFKENPRVIAQDPIGVYIRQYDAKIDTLYGRDINGYIYKSSDTARSINEAINNCDYSCISETMLNEGYDYLVMSERDTNDSLELIDCVGEYGIYIAKGTPSVIKGRNDNGQVLSITTVDQDGKPINNDAGYAKTLYSYDRNGNIIREFNVSLDGSGVADDKGIAGYEWAWDDHQHIVMERTLGADGNPVIAYQNYAEVRREYAKNEIVQESYYDDKGNPTVQPAGYTRFAQEWDNNKLINKVYLDAYGNPKDRDDGYSKIDWSGDGVVFYNASGETVSLKDKILLEDYRVDRNGWSDWMIPRYNIENSCFTITFAYLGEKRVGDIYTCNVEIEFKNVRETEGLDGEGFWIRAQGAVDGVWSIGNIWNDNLLSLREAPADGTYSFSSMSRITEKNTVATQFEIAFRCDYWSDGMFRVRNVTIEKGTTVPE